jgi:hypothetical protein
MKNEITHPIQNTITAIKNVLLSPGLFFRDEFRQWSVGRSLVFALVTHWIGTALDYLKTLVFQLNARSSFEAFLDKLNENGPIDSPLKNESFLHLKEKISQWYFSTGSVLMDPLSTLFSILFGAMVTWVAIRLFVKNPEPSQDFDHAFKLTCFAMTPILLSVIPFSGLFIPLYSLVLIFTGVKSIYQTSSERALIIALFPKLLWIGFILFLVAAFITTILVPLFFAFLS